MNDAINQLDMVSAFYSYSSFLFMGFGLFSALKTPQSYEGNTSLYQYINLATGIIGTGSLGYMYSAVTAIGSELNASIAGLGDVFNSMMLRIFLRFFFTETLPNYLNFFYLRGISQ